MEKAFVIFILGIMFVNMLIDGPIKDFFNWIWLGFWVLFFICLIIYGYWDRKVYPGNKKKHKEG